MYTASSWLTGSVVVDGGACMVLLVSFSAWSWIHWRETVGEINYIYMDIAFL